MKMLLALAGWLSAALIFAAALAVTPAKSSGIGFWETGPWGVCKTEAKAAEIADLYISDGEPPSSALFQQCRAVGDCAVLGLDVEMFIQAVVHRRGSARVVRVADRQGKLWYWLTTLPITGEPMPLDKDV